MTTSARAGSHEGPDSPQPWARTSAPPACGKTALPGLFLAPAPGPKTGPTAQALGHAHRGQHCRLPSREHTDPSGHFP